MRGFEPSHVPHVQAFTVGVVVWQEGGSGLIAGSEAGGAKKAAIADTRRSFSMASALPSSNVPSLVPGWPAHGDDSMVLVKPSGRRSGRARAP